MDELYQAYREKNYKKFLELFNEYLEQGYGVDIPIINTYVIALTKLRKYEEATRVLKNVEKELIKDRLITPVVNSYIRCFKTEEAERVINTYGVEDLDPLVLVELYLLEGRLDDARLETRIIRKNYNLDEYQKNRLNKYEKILYNHEYKNGLIETEYDAFVKNGNVLKPGHIIFLKNKPETDSRVSEDIRAINRSYMVWKVDGEKLYLFPVTSVCKKGYKLLHQKYPNSMGDRVVKNNPCTCYKKDVLSVKDRVLIEDYPLVLKAIYDSLYYGSEEQRDINKEFIKYYLKKPEPFRVVETVKDKVHYTYLVTGIKENIEAVEIDLEEQDIISDKVTFDKDTLFYNVYDLEEPYVNYFKDLLKINAFSKEDIRVR